MALKQKRLVANCLLYLAGVFAVGGIIADIAQGHLVGFPLILVGCLLFAGVIIWDIEETAKIRNGEYGEEERARFRGDK